MNVTVEMIEEGRARGALSGEVDADNSTEMGASLLQQIEAVEDITLDVSGLSFIDSSGISELLRIRDLLVSNGGSLTLEGPTDSVRRVLEITGLTATFGL